jgi:uncharacterized protein involved in exopolysaccharide biosynthesis
LITQIQERYEDRTIDLRDVFSRLWTKRLLLLVSVLVCTAPFAAAAFLMKPEYRAITVLAASNAEREGLGGGMGSALGQLGGLAALAGVNIGGNSADLEEAIAVMQSREFTEAFIRDHDLLPKLYPKLWDARTQRWNVPPGKQPTLAKAYKLFDKNIRTVVRDKKTGLVALQIDWKDRLEAAEWANDLVARLNAEMRARAIKKAEAYVGYLEQELTKTNVVATREAINHLIEAQIKQHMFANVNLDYAFRVVDKALPADADDPVKPRKVFLIAEGLALGLALGAAAVLLLARRPPPGGAAGGYRSMSSLTTRGE